MAESRSHGGDREAVEGATGVDRTGHGGGRDWDASTGRENCGWIV